MPKVVTYIIFDVTKLVMTEWLKDVSNEDVFHALFVCVDSMDQDDFGHLRAHINWFAVAVHVQVLKVEYLEMVFHKPSWLCLGMVTE